MPKCEEKPWDKSWTTQEMIENASNWSLAGDAGLLKYLETFSEKMLCKVKDTNDNLGNLCDSVNEASLSLKNVTNEFMGLRNTQFIESRVYEEDETLQTTQEAEKELTKQTEDDRLEEMKKAIFNGLEIIDQYYEKVDIPASDSEDETDDINVIYRPRDPYIDRPLPYIIGSAEWHKYWHVGLAHSSSDSELENEQEQFSETESEQERPSLPERDPSQIIGLSDSESEEVPTNKLTKPVANSTFNDFASKNMFDSSSESETGSLPPQVNTVNNNFAEELAAKLGKFETSVEPEVNKKPIMKPSTNIPAGIFLDEPPPLEEDDTDLFADKNAKSGLFSATKGLFDDLDGDTDFWETGTATDQIIPDKSAPAKPFKDIFSDDKEEDNNIFSNNSSDIKPVSKKSDQTKKYNSGIFNDEDDLFVTNSVGKSSENVTKTPPLFSDEPPEISPRFNSNLKKPVGPILLQVDSKKDVDKIANSVIDTSGLEKQKNPTEPIKNKPKEPEPTPKEIISIFDDTSPLFTDDIFASGPSNKGTSSLFSVDSLSPEDDLFKSNEIKKDLKEAKENKIEDKGLSISVPSLQNDLFDKASDFDKPIKQKSEEKIHDKKTMIKKPEITQESSQISGLYEPTDSDTSDKIPPFQNSGLFGDDTDLCLPIAPGKSHSLFDSDPPAIDSDLFEQNPPELDDIHTSESPFEDEADSFGPMNPNRASLFDTEPPLLSTENNGDIESQKTRFPDLTSTQRYSQISEENTKLYINPFGNESSLFNLLGKSSELPNTNKPYQNPELSPDNLFQNQDDALNRAEKSTSGHSLFQESDSDDDIFLGKQNKKINSSNSFKTSKSNDLVKDNSLTFNDDLPIKTNVSSDAKSEISKNNNDIKMNESQDVENGVSNLNKSIEQELEQDSEQILPKSEKPDERRFNPESSPGKLKHNLNINVAALLPGSAPQRKQNLEKSASLDSSENKSSSPVLDTKAPKKTISEVKPTLEKSVSFEYPAEPDTMLISAAKKRVKIPVKRRPSTRKARHEALRKSGIEFDLNDPIEETNSTTNKKEKETMSENILNIANNNLNEKANIIQGSNITLISSDEGNISLLGEDKQSEEESKMKNPLVNPLSPSTDEEDFFSMPRERDISVSFEENSLFGKAPIISPVDISNSDKQEKINEDVPNEKQISKIKATEEIASSLLAGSKMKVTDTSIFSSSDSENDLFSSFISDPKKPSGKNMFDNNNATISSDDDLFKPIVTESGTMKQSKDYLFEEDNTSVKKGSLKSTIAKTSLFDDDDDGNDDIFGGSSNLLSKPSSSSSSVSKTVHSSQGKSSTMKKGVSRLKKLTADLVDDIHDPLDALKK